MPRTSSFEPQNLPQPPEPECPDSGSLDLHWIRSRFPALSTEWALFDNAGGSVVLGAVADAVADYLRTLGVQLGATYPQSVSAVEKVQEGHRAMETWAGADEGEIVLGSSTTTHLANLARGLRPLWNEGDEVVITDLDHEANRGPWKRLEASGIRLRHWPLRPETASLELDDLDDLLSSRTRLVAMTHCANVVGRIHDIPAVAERVHAAGALLCVDGVAYAPHRRVDVRSLGADFYAWSLYKTFGPHQAALWGRRELLEELRGQSHDFITEDDVPYKLEPGGVNHELTASLPALVDYLDALDRHHGGAPDRPLLNRLDSAFERISLHEEGLTARLLAFLSNRRDIHILGPATADRRQRVSTVAFVVEGRSSAEIPALLERHQVAIRWGHFYAPQAIRALDLDEQSGIVRASLLHYNTLAEVDRLIAGLEEALDSPTQA